MNKEEDISTAETDILSQIEKTEKLKSFLVTQGKPNSNTTPSDLEVLWRNYALHVDLYKQYLDLTLRFNIFYYAITGAMLSFFFTNQDKGIVKYLLLFPMLMSMFFSLLSFYAASRVNLVSQELKRISTRLAIEVWPDTDFLSFLLRTCGALFTTVYIGIMLILIFFK